MEPVDGVEVKAQEKSIAFDLGDTKGKRTAETAKEGEQPSPDGLSLNPTAVEDTESGSHNIVPARASA